MIYRTLYFNSKESKESENIFGTIESFELDEKQKNKLFTKFFNTDSINNIWLKCIKREDVIGKYKEYIENTHFTYMEDKLHTLLIFSSCSQIVYIPDILHKYRKHETAASSKASLEWIIEFINLCGIFQTFFETNLTFKKFQKSAFIFFKTQLSRLYVWYIGQNVSSLRTLRQDIEKINQLILAQNLPFQNVHSKSLLYDDVFKMVCKNHIILLVPICKLYVKFLKDKKGKKYEYNY